MMLCFDLYEKSVVKSKILPYGIEERVNNDNTIKPTMSTKQKINFTQTFGGKEINFKNVPVEVYENGVYSQMRGVSSVVRQFVKQMFPEAGKFQIGSDSFSMGDSVNLYFDEISNELFDEINRTTQAIFERGNFNGMIDLYEYKENYGVRTEVNGYEVTFSTKYMSSRNTPKYGTKAYEAYKERQQAA